MTLDSTLRSILIGLVVLMLGGFGGWYLYLRTKESTLTATDAARGFGAVTPSFTGEIGSSHENTLASLAATTTPTSTGGGSRQLWHADKAPIAGYGFVSSPGSTTLLYFVERATGYIYKADPDAGTVVRMSSTLTPKVYEAFVALDGSVIQRGLNDAGDIESTLVTSTASSSGARRTALPRAMTPFATNPGGTLVYGTSDDSGAITLWSGPWDTSHTKNIFTSPIAHWRVDVPEAGRTIITEQAASGVIGHSYTINKDNSLTPFTPALPGLSVLPQASTTAAIYSADSGNAAHLFVRSSAQSAPASLAITTISDKCAWGPALPPAKKGGVAVGQIAYCAVPDSMSPHFIDAWYRGEVHTTDAWFRINAQTGTTTRVIVDFSSAALPPDVKHPVVSRMGNYIAYEDARDQSLWILKLAQ